MEVPSVNEDLGDNPKRKVTIYGMSCVQEQRQEVV